MKDGGDILCSAIRWRPIRAPAGVVARRHGTAQGLDQPHAVRESVRQFVKVLAEAVAIVLVVSFFSARVPHGPRGRGVDPARYSR